MFIATPTIRSDVCISVPVNLIIITDYDYLSIQPTRRSASVLCSETQKRMCALQTLRYAAPAVAVKVVASGAEASV